MENKRLLKVIDDAIELLDVSPNGTIEKMSTFEGRMKFYTKKQIFLDKINKIKKEVSSK